MRAQRFIESLPYTPSSAWAARPLASGARLSLIARRACSGAGVGCPSFGGQRTVSGCSSRIRAGLVTRLKPIQLAKRAGADFGVFNSQTTRSAADATVNERVVGQRTGTVTAPGQRTEGKSCLAGLTETAEIQSPMRQSRAPFTASVESWLARPSSKGWSAAVGATPAPNHSVKGTSCGKPQAAPYLER